MVGPKGQLPGRKLKCAGARSLLGSVVSSPHRPDSSFLVEGGWRILMCIDWGERLGPEKQDQANAMSVTSHCIMHP